MSRLKFAPGNHTYRLDGQLVPSVSTILKGVPKPALVYWSAKSVAEYVAANRETVERLWGGPQRGMVAYLKEVPWQKRDDAADRGTIVHGITESVIRHGEAQVPEVVAGYVQAAADFLDDFRVRVIAAEVRGWHDEHLYAGTADLLAEIPGHGTCVVEWKSGDSGVWPEAALQVAAYRAFTHCVIDGQDQPMPETHAGLGVHLRADGYTAYRLRSDADVYRTFRHVRVVADLARDIDKNRDEWVAEIAPPGKEVAT